MLSIQELDDLIIRVPDYPKPGIIFQDISPVLANPAAFASLVNHMVTPFRDMQITHVVGIEARGFLLASAMAHELHAGLIPARKVGKLPRPTYSAEYDLEYGKAAIEIHQDALVKSDRVLLVDDVLATGGTLAAAVSILAKQQAELIGIAVLSEITFLNGRAKLLNVPIHSIIK